MRSKATIILIVVGVVMVCRSFILVNKEVTVAPGSPLEIRLPAVIRFWGRVEADSIRMMFQVINESNYEDGASLIKTRWTKNLSFDVENERLERVYYIVSNTNVDPEVKISVRVRSYGLAPLSPWLLTGLFLITAGIIFFVKKDRE